MILAPRVQSLQLRGAGIWVSHPNEINQNQEIIAELEGDRPVLIVLQGSFLQRVPRALSGSVLTPLHGRAPGPCLQKPRSLWCGAPRCEEQRSCSLMKLNRRGERWCPRFSKPGGLKPSPWDPRAGKGFGDLVVILGPASCSRAPPGAAGIHPDEGAKQLERFPGRVVRASGVEGSRSSSSLCCVSSPSALRRLLWALTWSRIHWLCMTQPHSGCAAKRAPATGQSQGGTPGTEPGSCPAPGGPLSLLS